jgi:hypothetical protein
MRWSEAETEARRARERCRKSKGEERCEQWECPRCHPKPSWPGQRKGGTVMAREGTAFELLTDAMTEATATGQTIEVDFTHAATGDRFLLTVKRIGSDVVEIRRSARQRKERRR